MFFNKQLLVSIYLGNIAPSARKSNLVVGYRDLHKHKSNGQKTISPKPQTF